MIPRKLYPLVYFVLPLLYPVGELVCGCRDFFHISVLMQIVVFVDFIGISG